MAAIEDRKYQSDALDAVSAQWRQGKKRVVLVMPCGAGKGTVTAMCIRKAAANGKVSVVLVHRRNLVKQLAERMGQFGIRYSTVMSNLPKEPWVRHDPAPQCWICSKDTLLSQMSNGRWDERINADLCFTDECHRIEQVAYNKLIKACPAKYHLGLTATPVRPDGSGLGSNNWDSLVVGATVKQLVSLGHLVPHRVYAPPGVCMRRRLGRPVRPSGNPIDEWVRHASGKRTIAFLPDVATARDMAAKFKDAGIPSAVLSAQSPDEERTAVLAKLKSGEILWLANVDLFTEGMDCPEIEVCQIVRKWDSLWSMMQGVGRAFRPAAHIGKTHAVILDHTGTTAKHGYPDIEPEWRLDETGEEFERRHRERVQKELGDPVDCRKCGAVFAGTPKCPYCGTPVPPSTKRKELVYEEEGLAPAGSVFAPVVSKEQKAWDRVRFSARYKGMSCGWAFMVFKTKTGKTPQQAGVRPLFTYDQREMPVAEAERVLSRR